MGSLSPIQRPSGDDWQRRSDALLAALESARDEVLQAVRIEEDPGPIDLAHYLTARSALDRAVSDWNLRTADHDDAEAPRFDENSDPLAMGRGRH
jgi:hypothetical protein